MRVKWICDDCNSINSGEKTTHMVCFVCGKARTTERLMPLKDTAPEHTELWGEKPAAPAAESGKGNLWSRLMKFLSSLRKCDADLEEEKRETAGWKIVRSPRESSEAYLDSVPVYADEEEHKAEPKFKPELKPDAGRGRIVLKRKPASEAKAEFDWDGVRLWPEDKLTVDVKVLKDSGCIRMEQTVKAGTKGYQLYYKNGSERFLTAQNMKLVGYLKAR